MVCQSGLMFSQPAEVTKSNPHAQKYSTEPECPYWYGTTDECMHFCLECIEPACVRITLSACASRVFFYFIKHNYPQEKLLITAGV